MDPKRSKKGFIFSTAKDICENISICPIWRKYWPDIFSVFPLALWENGQIWCLDVFQDTESTSVGPVIGRGKGNEKGLSCYLLSQHLRCTLSMYFHHYHEVKRKCDLISHKPREMYSDLDIFLAKEMRGFWKPKPTSGVCWFKVISLLSLLIFFVSVLFQNIVNALPHPKIYPLMNIADSAQREYCTIFHCSAVCVQA